MLFPKGKSLVNLNSPTRRKEKAAPVVYILILFEIKHLETSRKKEEARKSKFVRKIK